MRHRLSLLTLLVLGLLQPSEASAAKFVVGLTSLKMSARPAEVSTHSYQLTLDKSERPTRFKFRIEDWWRSEDGTQSFYAAPGTLKRSCGSWVALNPVEAVVEPGETLTTRLSVSIPADAGGGGYWCVLTVDEVPDPLEMPTGVGAKFVASVSTGIFIYIEPVERAVNFVDIQIAGAEALLKLRNEGNSPVGVEGRFEFYRPGELALVAAVSMPRTTLLTEPIPTGVMRAPLPPLSTLPPGRYVIRAIIDIGLDHYLGVERELDLSRDVALQVGP